VLDGPDMGIVVPDAGRSQVIDVRDSSLQLGDRRIDLRDRPELADFWWWGGSNDLRAIESLSFKRI
jgi:hypothetical protein